MHKTEVVQTARLNTSIWIGIHVWYGNSETSNPLYDFMFRPHHLPPVKTLPQVILNKQQQKDRTSEILHPSLQIIS